MLPKINIPNPDQRLMLMPRDRLYNAVSPLVTAPKMVSRNPRMKNISPIGNFISMPMVVGKLVSW